MHKQLPHFTVTMYMRMWHSSCRLGHTTRAVCHGVVWSSAHLVFSSRPPAADRRNQPLVSLVQVVTAQPTLARCCWSSVRIQQESSTIWPRNQKISLEIANIVFKRDKKLRKKNTETNTRYEGDLPEPLRRTPRSDQ